MDATVIDRFRRIIAAHTGLAVPDRDSEMLRAKLEERLGVLRMPFPELYLSLLEEETGGSRDEWRELVLSLTTGESYFFRDTGQIALLRETILPELIAGHRDDRTLRIWSAGCSTGEEPYSLAILISRLLPPRETWRVTLLGTDINERALERARRGRYCQWSFRGVDSEIIGNHFRKIGGEWQLDHAIRDQVVFRRVNLIRDLFPDPDSGLSEIDLILCRNVFIYFDRETVARVVKKFARTLRPGGYLLTGHAEIQHPVTDVIGLGPDRLVSRSFPQSVILQRPAPAMTAPEPAAPAPPRRPVVFSPLRGGGGPPVGGWGGYRPKPAAVPAVPPRPAPAVPPRPASVDVAQRLAEARRLFDQGVYGEAATHAEAAVGNAQCAFDARLLLARIQANLGNGSAAESHCREALRIQPFAPSPHYLLAHVLQERGESDQARELLLKTIYLDRNHIPAYLELAAVYQGEGNAARSKKMRQAALDALESLSEDARVENYEEWSAGELARQVRTLLEQSPAG